MIIISGASSKIFTSLINKFSKIDDLLCLYNRNHSISKKINNSSSKYKIKFMKINLTNELEIEKLCSKVVSKKIVLLNFAAIHINKLVINMTTEEYDLHYKVNTRSVFLLSKFLIPKMIKNQWGKIIMLSSPASKIGHAGASGYSSSKSALNGLSRSITNEYSKFNITSNIINIGYYDQGIYKNLPEKIKKNLINEVPAKKLLDVKQIFNAVNFIIKNDNVNGSVLSIDAGITY